MNRISSWLIGVGLVVVAGGGWWIDSAGQAHEVAYAGKEVAERAVEIIEGQRAVLWMLCSQAREAGKPESEACKALRLEIEARKALEEK